MWACEMSLAHRGPDLAHSNHDSCASPPNLPYYTQVLALIMQLLRNSRILQRPTPKTYQVLNLSGFTKGRNRFSESQYWWMCYCPQCQNDNGTCIILPESPTVPFYHILHSFVQWTMSCLPSLTYQEAFCLFINRVSLDITKFMILFPHP